MRTVRFRGRLKDGSIAGDVVPPDILQQGWHIDLTDVANGERVLHCLHATIEIDHDGSPFTAMLTFRDGTQEQVYALIA